MQRTSLLHTVAAAAVLTVLLLIAFPKAQAQTETVLYNFCSAGEFCNDGEGPGGSLTVGWYGNFYGTTRNGGANGGGAVFGLYPEPAGGCDTGSNTGNGWCEFVLYNFCSVGAPTCYDGKFPEGNVSYLNAHFNRPGNLYGTTYQGGTSSNCAAFVSCGMVFEIFSEPLTPPGCPSGTNGGNGWCEAVLYNFCSLSNCVDGYLPSGNLVEDSAGNLYGTVADGVFELSPNGGGGWTEALIYWDDDIQAGLAIDSAGNLYGVDAINGAGGHVFKLSHSENEWAAVNIHTFESPGSLPTGPPALDNAGNVYGTTIGAGSASRGMVWKLSPVTKGKNAGTYTLKIPHSFTAEETGWKPQGGVTLDSAGNIYGTAAGGSGTECGKSGCGVVFELAVSDATYTYKLLWSFNGTGAQEPGSSPFLGSSGSLYGVAAGGTNSAGTVYEVTP